MIKPATITFLILASTMAVSHYFALVFYLYWRYLWLDIPMHVLGGMTAMLGLFSFRDFFPLASKRLFNFIPALSFVLLVAVVWEVYEVLIGIPVTDPNYVSDTVIDLCMGLTGGLFGYFISKSISRRTRYE